LAKKIAGWVVSALVVLVLYLFLWPVPIDPGPWKPKPVPELRGSFAENRVLQGRTTICYAAEPGLVSSGRTSHAACCFVCAATGLPLDRVAVRTNGGRAVCFEGLGPAVLTRGVACGASYPTDRISERETLFPRALNAQVDGGFQFFDLCLAWTFRRCGNDRHTRDLDTTLGARAFAFVRGHNPPTFEISKLSTRSTGGTPVAYRRRRAERAGPSCKFAYHFASYSVARGK